MASVNFHLSTKPKQNGQRLLLIYFKYGGKQIVLSTNESIDPINWDSKLKKVKSKHQGYSEINNLILKYQHEFIKVYQNRKLQGLSVESEALKAEFKNILNPPKVNPSNPNLKSTPMDFTTYIEKFITKVNFNKSPNTIRIYRRNLDILKEFESKVWQRKLEFEDIDIDFYLKWKEFVLKKYKFVNNSINKHTGLLKLFMGEAADDGLHKNYQYRSKKFATPRVPTDNIYLDDDDIETLLKLDLSSNSRLERVRDLFVIASKTGLRFSDLSQLTDSLISKDNKTIHISNIIKTGGTVHIPIHPMVFQIFEKYKRNTGSSIPKLLSNQKMNDYLKEIGVLAKFDDNITISSKSGNKIIKNTYKKFELVTTHTARRSFATNEYLRGTPVYLIMAITNHKTEKAFLSYIKITQRMYSDMLADLWNNQKTK